MLDGEERNHNGLTLAERLLLLEKEMDDHKAQDRIDHKEIMDAIDIIRAASLWGRFVMWLALVAGACATIWGAFFRSIK